MARETTKMFITELRDKGTDTDGKLLVLTKIVSNEEQVFPDELPATPSACYNLKGQPACGDNAKFMNGSLLWASDGDTQYIYLDGAWRLASGLPAEAVSKIWE